MRQWLAAVILSTGCLDAADGPVGPNDPHPSDPPVELRVDPTPTNLDLPENIDRHIISTGMAAVKPAVLDCGTISTARGIVKTTVEVAPDGRVARVQTRSAPSQELGDCVAHTIQQARFAATRKGGRFTYPFVF